jgi:hypothetical protein
VAERLKANASEVPVTRRALETQPAITLRMLDYVITQPHDCILLCSGKVCRRVEKESCHTREAAVGAQGS